MLAAIAVARGAAAVEVPVSAAFPDPLVEEGVAFEPPLVVVEAPLPVAAAHG